MQEREITADEIQIGDVIRLEQEFHGVKSTAQGPMRERRGAYIILGNGLAYDTRVEGCKIILIDRPAKETPIKPEDIRLGMWVCINGMFPKQVIGVALRKDCNGDEFTEAHLGADGCQSSFVTCIDIRKIQTALVVDAPIA